MNPFVAGHISKKPGQIIWPHGTSWMENRTPCFLSPTGSRSVTGFTRGSATAGGGAPAVMTLQWLRTFLWIWTVQLRVSLDCLVWLGLRARNFPAVCGGAAQLVEPKTLGSNPFVGSYLWPCIKKKPGISRTLQFGTMPILRWSLCSVSY